MSPKVYARQAPICWVVTQEGHMSRFLYLDTYLLLQLTRVELQENLLVGTLPNWASLTQASHAAQTV